jgi:hypothetical protein
MWGITVKKSAGKGFTLIELMIVIALHNLIFYHDKLFYSAVENDADVIINIFCGIFSRFIKGINSFGIVQAL